MAIVYDPKAMLERLASKKKIANMLTKRVTLKKTALNFLDDADFLSKKNVTETALKVIKSYQQKITEDGIEPHTFANDPKLLIQRVQNNICQELSAQIRDVYSGEKYEWLPSDAEEPDPEHQLKYGEIFDVGVGEMPGERYGCRCGMRILVNQTQLKLD